jgi:enamine deaminase RidA (YjgF/YER057c/UK114 family)
MTSYFQYFQPDGPVGEFCQKHGFSNAIILPKNSRIVTVAGQAGLDLKTGQVVTSSIEDQMAAAFDCIEASLLKAGVKDGLGAVYKFITFLYDPRYEPTMMEIWRRRQPDHRPIWMCIGASSFCLQGMVCEFHAEAVLLDEEQ